MLLMLRNMSIRMKLMIVILVFAFIGGSIMSMFMQFNQIRSWLNPLYHYGSLFSFGVLWALYIHNKRRVSKEEGDQSIE
jgi:threonine/homoserine efflux transporter RhtA